MPKHASAIQIFDMAVLKNRYGCTWSPRNNDSKLILGTFAKRERSMNQYLLAAVCAFAITAMSGVSAFAQNSDGKEKAPMYS